MSVDFKRLTSLNSIFVALVLSFLVHGILLAVILTGSGQYLSEEDGQGGFERGSRLDITLGDIQRVNDSSPVRNKVAVETKAVGTQNGYTSFNASTSTESEPVLNQAEKLEQKSEEVGGGNYSEQGVDNQSGNIKGNEEAYYAKILEILNSNKRYNKLAVERGLQGTSVIRFSIAANGELLEHELLKSSGEFILDRSAEEMLINSAPFPSFPKNFHEKSISIELPVEYALKKQP